MCEGYREYSLASNAADDRPVSGPAIILYVTHYAIVPNFVADTGCPYLVGYLIG